MAAPAATASRRNVDIPESRVIFIERRTRPYGSHVIKKPTLVPDARLGIPRISDIYDSSVLRRKPGRLSAVLIPQKTGRLLS